MLKLSPSKKTIHGFAYFDHKTKHLARYIPVHALAVIKHEDIDEMAAVSLIQRGVKAVLNLASSMSGAYYSLGTQELIRSGIPVFDIEQDVFFQTHFQQGDMLIIHDQQLYRLVRGENQWVASLIEYTEGHVAMKRQQAELNGIKCLRSFTENTLLYAKNELNEILSSIPLPKLHVPIKNRHALIVTRGPGHIEDLKSLIPYIEKNRPVLIGVDGGADALLDCGLCPDIILGDMDSVTSYALHSGAELIVHAYKNGYGPGVEELQKHGLAGQAFPCFGTSEDAAHLLAYEAGAALIVTVGSHTSMLDYLEKGRKGMGSSLLVRLKVGEKLVDAKGVRHLFNYEI